MITQTEVVHTCSIGWNTTIAAGESITFFRSKTQIEFDYFEDDFAVLKDTSGETQSMLKYPTKDSFYDVAYILNDDGTLGKADANPAERHGTCFAGVIHRNPSTYSKEELLP